MWGFVEIEIGVFEIGLDWIEKEKEKEREGGRWVNLESK
jgi:hypothetical protein